MKKNTKKKFNLINVPKFLIILLGYTEKISLINYIFMWF